MRKVDLIFSEPPQPSNPLNYRAHMYAPAKHFMGMTIDTFWFNIGVIWTMTIILYITLYFNVFERLVNIRRVKR